MPGPDLETKTKGDARGLKKSPTLQGRAVYSSPVAFPPKFPDESVMQLHFNNQKVCKHPFQTPQMLCWKESNTKLRGLCLSLLLPGWMSKLPEKKHIWFLKLGRGWRDWLLWFEFTSMQECWCSAFYFSKQKTPLHPKDTCCPHCQLSFPSCRQEVKTWKSLKTVSESIYNLKFHSLFSAGLWNKMYKLPRMFWHVWGLFPVFTWCWSA